MNNKTHNSHNFFRTDANDSRMYQYGSDWEPVLFSIQNGGYNVYHKDHNFSKHAGGGYAEKVVGMILAVINGKQVEFLPEKAREGRHPDVRFDNLTWDIKNTSTKRAKTPSENISGTDAKPTEFYSSGKPSPGKSKF